MMGSTRNNLVWLGTAALVSLSASQAAQAHEVRPALLEITEHSPGLYDVTWKVPTRGDMVLGLEPELPPCLKPLGATSSHKVPGALIQRATYQCDGGSLIGQSVSIKGLSTTLTDVLLRVRLIGGQTQSIILRPSSPSYTIAPFGDEDPRTVITRNLSAALGHLAGSANHIFLILALVLLACGRQAFKVIIAFIVGHAASMVLADLGILGPQPGLAEVLCAAAVVLAASSAAAGRYNALSFLAPVFGVSLFHGLAHARTLAEAGTGKPNLIYALFAFNWGLDVGTIVLLIVFGVILAKARQFKGFEKMRTLGAYAVGASAVAVGIAAFMDTAAAGSTARAEGLRRQRVAQFELPAGPRVRPTTPAGSSLAEPSQPQEPLSLFLTIEPYEVRLEVLLRVKDLIAAVQQRPLEGQIIKPDSQGRLIEDVLSFAECHHSVIIDDAAATPTLRRGEFVTLETYGVLPRKQAVAEAAETALIGLTFVYEADQLPQHVKLDWNMYTPAVRDITATVTDPFGGSQELLSQAQPTLSWQNRLSAFTVPVIEPVLVEPLRVPLLSMVLCLVAFVAFLIARRGGSKGVAGGLAVGCVVAASVAYPFVRTAVAQADSGYVMLTERQANFILGGLLDNVYRAFDLRDESVVYDRLAMTVSGDQLTEIYLQSRQALEMEDRGGAKGRVDEVAVSQVRAVTRQADDSFAVEAVWTVGGSVSHFGHTHYRRNQYHAVVGIFADRDHWKIRRVTVLDERRLL